MGYFEEDTDAYSRIAQQLELELKKALREELETKMRDYDEYTRTMAFNSEFMKTEISFNQWSDIKYNNLKHIRQWTRKRF